MIINMSPYDVTRCLSATSSQAAHALIRKTLHKRRNERAKDDIIIRDEYNQYSFIIQKGKKHTFGEFTDLRTTIHTLIGLNLDRSPFVTTVSINIPKWYRTWYKLILDDLHLKGFRAGIKYDCYDPPYIPYASKDDLCKVTINKKEYIYKFIRFDKNNRLVYSPSEKQLHDNLEMRLACSDYFDTLTIRPMVPYREKLHRDTTSCIMIVSDTHDEDSTDKHMDAEMLMTTRGRVKVGNPLHYSIAFFKRHNKKSPSNVVIIDLKYLYKYDTLDDDFKEFLSKARLYSVDFWTRISESDYSDSRIYSNGRARTLKETVKVFYDIYKLDRRIKNGEDPNSVAEEFNNSSSTSTSNILQ